MGDRASRSRLSRGPVGTGLPRALRPYKQDSRSAFVAVFLVLLMIGVTVGSSIGGLARWTLVFPWLMVPCSIYCFFRERPCKTVIPGAYWGLGQALFALGAVALLLVLY